MECQIGEAIEKIDKLISHGSKVDDNTINKLIKVKKKLNSVKDIRMLRMQSNNTGSESKTPEFDKKGFNGYVSIKDTGGKGSAEGDAKDKAMREVANGFIGEVNKSADSSTLTSYLTISETADSTTIKNDINDDLEEDRVSMLASYEEELGDVIMLARNGSLKGKELQKFTKGNILDAHIHGASFVVGDMPGVDTQFIEYLNKIGASYKVYTTNEAGKEFDRKGIDGSKYRNIVETKSQNETKSSEPDVKYGSVVKYKPENGTEGYYVVRGFSSNGGLQLTDSEGKNFSGTPNVNKVKFIKQLKIKRYNNVDYIIDSNNKVYTQNGKVADSYVDRLLNNFGISKENKQEDKQNETVYEIAERAIIDKINKLKNNHTSFGNEYNEYMINLEKFLDKLLTEGLKSSVTINYSKETAFKFMNTGVAGSFIPKNNLIVLPDFDSLLSDKDLMDKLIKPYTKNKDIDYEFISDFLNTKIGNIDKLK